MEPNKIARGQLSEKVLFSLKESDKYGYEIIDFIKINNDIIVKKPSLYSCLTRLEEQGLVSSYWKDSDIGGKRHYYRLTENGRIHISDSQKIHATDTNVKVNTNLKQENLFEVPAKIYFQDNISKNNQAINNQNSNTVEKKENTTPSETTKKNKQGKDFLQFNLFNNTDFVAQPLEDDEDIFHFETNEQTPQIFNATNFNLNENEKIKVENFEKTEKDNNTQVKKAFDIKEKNENNKITPDSNSNIITKKEKKKKEKSFKSAEEEKKDKVSEQTILFNEFNFEQEFEKYYRSMPSYTETIKTGKIKLANHLTKSPEISKTSNTFGNQVSTQQSFENVNTKALFNDDIPLPHLIMNKDQIQEQTAKKNDKNDDAVLITATPIQPAKVKKIAPAVFPITQTNNNYKTNQTENSYFRKKEDFTQNNYDDFEDDLDIDENYVKESYQTLKEYFQTKNLKLKIYDKTNLKIAPFKEKLKLNKSNFFSNLIFFILTLIETITCYILLDYYSLLPPNIIWFFIAISLIFTVKFVVSLISFLKKIEIKKEFNPLWFKLILIIIGSGIIFAVNYLFGLNQYNFLEFSSTLFLPIAIIINYIIIHFVNLIILNINTNNLNNN